MNLLILILLQKKCEISKTKFLSSHYFIKINIKDYLARTVEKFYKEYS